MLKVLAITLVLIALCQCDDSEQQNTGEDARPGHLKPLGSHRPPEGDVEILEYVPHPTEFYEKYVAASKPVLMRGATRGSRAYKLWNDKYLAEKFGGLIIMTEHGKKENRTDDISYIQLKTFLNRYNHTDEYLVETLPPAMREDFQLLRSLLCGSFTNNLRDAVLWFSSGGTKSVLHYDNVDNINCLMSGSKDLFLAHKDYVDFAHMDASAAHSNVDVDSVDVDKYPGLGKIPWWRAHMEAGDCFYIPYRWVHQIRSFNRNLAINIWWVPLAQFDKPDCYVDRKLDGELRDLEDYSSLSNYQFSPGEALRNELLETIDENHEGKIKKRDVLGMAYSGIDGEDPSSREVKAYMNHQKDGVNQMFELVDANDDQCLNRAEVMNIPTALIVDIFGEEGKSAATEVMDQYARTHPDIEADELDGTRLSESDEDDEEEELELPAGSKFPADFNPDNFDMDEYLNQGSKVGGDSHDEL